MHMCYAALCEDSVECTNVISNACTQIGRLSCDLRYAIPYADAVLMTGRTSIVS